MLGCDDRTVFSMANIKYRLSGPAIQRRRILKGWSQRELARRSKLAASTISTLERETTKGTPRVWVSVAGALDVPLESLLEEEHA